MPELILLTVLIFFLVADVLSLIGIFAGMPSFLRAIYHKVRGYRVVKMPDDIRVATANGLIGPGSELVVAAAHEGIDGAVSRFALHPSVTGLPCGKSLRVVSVSADRLVLEEIFPRPERAGAGSDRGSE